MIKMLPSHPDYERMNFLQTLYIMLCNPGMYVGVVDMDWYEMEEAKLNVLQELKALQDSFVPESFYEIVSRLESEHD